MTTNQSNTSTSARALLLILSSFLVSNSGAFLRVCWPPSSSFSYRHDNLPYRHQYYHHHYYGSHQQQLFAAARDEKQQAAIFSKEHIIHDNNNNNNQQQQKDFWRDAVIVSSKPACPSGKSTLIEIQVVDDNDNQATQYTTPGQFVQFRPKNDDSIDPIFLAISSAPSTITDGSKSSSSSSSSSTLQFLIKMSPRLPWLPETLVTGNTVQVSSIMGDGFPLHKLGQGSANNRSTTILLAAAGSGIAPLKACLESGLLLPEDSSQTTKILLYYGEWTRDDLCFTNLYDEWRDKLGVTLIQPVLSRTPDTQGYIQDAWAQDNGDDDHDDDSFSLDNNQPFHKNSTWAILCGMDDMVESCTQVLTSLGVEQDHILLNL